MTPNGLSLGEFAMLLLFPDWRYTPELGSNEMFNCYILFQEDLCTQGTQLGVGKTWTMEDYE